jgi:hypothetical protein
MFMSRYNGSGGSQGLFAMKVWPNGNASFDGYDTSWFWTWDTESSELNTNSGTITTGNWWHIAVTFDGTNYVIYQNAVSKQSKTAPGHNLGDSSDTDPLAIGAFGTNLGNPFPGSIQEVQFYNTNLPATGPLSIATLYSGGAGYYARGGEANLVACYHLDGTPNDVKGNNGSWVGTANYAASPVCGGLIPSPAIRNSGRMDNCGIFSGGRI